MRALDPEVVDAIWAAVEPLLPPPDKSHPLGCHNPRISDRICFDGILIRLVTGVSWMTVERLMRNVVSDTTLRARRDEWITAGVFDALADEALHAYDRIIEFDLSETSIDGSQHKAPCGGDGTGRNSTDRGKLGWKWSLLCDRAGIPVSWAIEGAHRHDIILFEPTLAAANARGLATDIETLHLDRGYDAKRVRDCVTSFGITDLICPKRRLGTLPVKASNSLGMRWSIERTNSWLSNFGQLRRNTDRTSSHRLAQLALAITAIITIKLLDWRNRWSPNPCPTR
jgi:transposase